MKEETIRLAGARPVITWTPSMLKRFKRAYETQCIKCGHTSFWFEHHEFLSAYAKYLIEFLEGQFKGVAL